MDTNIVWLALVLAMAIYLVAIVRTTKTGRRPTDLPPGPPPLPTLNSADFAANPDVSKRDHFLFVSGRRICQGMHVVDCSLFFAIARLFWGFDLKPRILSDGSSPKIDPDRYTQGFVCMPEPFEANITPRSPERERIMRRDWEIAREGLDPETLQWRSLPEGMKKQKMES